MGGKKEGEIDYKIFFFSVYKYLLKFVVPPASMDLFTQVSAYASTSCTRAAQIICSKLYRTYFRAKIRTKTFQFTGPQSDCCYNSSAL